jgi:hypothetical protein
VSATSAAVTIERGFALAIARGAVVETAAIGNAAIPVDTIEAPAIAEVTGVTVGNVEATRALGPAPITAAELGFVALGDSVAVVVLVAVPPAVSIAVAIPGIGSIVELAAVFDAIVVGITIARVTICAPFLTVQRAVAVGVGVLGIGHQRRFDAVEETIGVGIDSVLVAAATRDQTR